MTREPSLCHKGFPILARVFEQCSPDPEDNRYKHSDSAVGYLLSLPAVFNPPAANFGLTLSVEEIRRAMPRTRIEGQLAPFNLMNNDEQAIIEEVKRDCTLAREARGISLSTADSINNGSLLTSLRIVMAAIQNYGRY